MPEIIEAKSEGYACDRCGAVVSRNQPDGCGGVSWWGVRAALESKQDEEIKIKFDLSSLAQMSLQKIGRPEKRHEWVLCHECADELETVINEWTAQCNP